MSFTRKYIKDSSFVLTLVKNGANDKLLEEHVDLLTTETEGMRPFIELADASELNDVSEFTEIGTAVASILESKRKPYKLDKLAILVSTDDAYRFAGIYGSVSIYYRRDTKIFRDFKQAIEWLGVTDLENEINNLRNKLD